MLRLMDRALFAYIMASNTFLMQIQNCSNSVELTMSTEGILLVDTKFEEARLLGLLERTPLMPLGKLFSNPLFVARFKENMGDILEDV